MKKRIELRSKFANFHKRIADQHENTARSIRKSGGDISEAQRQERLALEHREEQYRYTFARFFAGNEVTTIR